MKKKLNKCCPACTQKMYVIIDSQSNEKEDRLQCQNCYTEWFPSQCWFNKLNLDEQQKDVLRSLKDLFKPKED